MNVYHISDTHMQHDSLVLPDLTFTDVMVCTGDATNNRNPIFNEQEFYEFVEWYTYVNVEHKIYIAGNHSSFVATHEKEARRVLESKGIIYLNKEEVTINGVKFYGDPTSPNFGNWYFMAKREKMYKHWSLIPDDVEVLLTHTPPQGILDLSYDLNGCLEFCGCKSLYKKCQELGLLKAVCFGHIHCFSSDTEILTNKGWRNMKTIKDTDLAINMNMNTGSLEYDDINEIIKSYYKGDIIKVKSSVLNFIVTPDHELIDAKNKKPYKFKAGDIKNKRSRMFYNSGILEQKDYDISDNEIMLMIQCTTDGSWESSAWRFHLKKERKIKRLTKLLREMGIPFSECIQKTGNTKIRFKYDFKIRPKPLSIEVAKFSQRQLTILFEEYYVTDGYRCQEGYNSFQINTSKKEEAGIIQMLGVISGRSVMVTKRKNSENYTLSITEKRIKRNYDTNNIKSKDIYEGEIWCVSSNNKTVISRRKGRVLISGNSSREIQTNQGIYVKDGIQYSNAACVTDGQFDRGCSSHGNLLNIS